MAPLDIRSSWIIEDGLARPLGAKKRSIPGRHKLTKRQEETRRRRAREEQARRRGWL